MHGSQKQSDNGDRGEGRGGEGVEGKGEIVGPERKN